MDAYMITFRIIHVVSAILWVGSGVFFVAFVGPTLQAFGPEGGKFFAHLVRQRKAVVWFVTVSTLTVVAGGFLYWRTSGGLDINWMQTGIGIGFTVGAIAGITAWLLVLLVLTPTVKRLVGLGGQIAGGGGPPSQELMMMLQATQSRQKRVSYIITTLILIAAAAMATARYLF
ncbi:MAG TPA: hypothetical protein VHI54_08630 [Actinomycetota bacterium]|nr:hypothetical protein [Actinomycetota bacterium]